MDWLSERGRQGDRELDKILGPEGLHFLTIAQLSDSSLLPVRKKRAPLQPTDYEVLEIPEGLKHELREKSLAKMRHSISRDKVRSYVYLYGYDGETGYLLDRKNNRIIDIGGYRFYDRQIRRLQVRKGGSRRVRNAK